uniref:GATA transcription factor 28 n=1 Tax=Aegilops tauschii TaxID=37682 RepID=M8CD27_AEGTA
MPMRATVTEQVKRRVQIAEEPPSRAGTPLWRNGPPDKPVFCNACGLIWRIKGTLVNYMRAHRREDTGAGEAGPDKLKLKGQK